MERYDAIVVGGGHNGLVAAAYLARAGLRALVCEAREVVGGAAVTEHPFGPDYTVTSLSYVVSLLPPALVARPATCTGTATTSTRRGPYFAPHAPTAATCSCPTTRSAPARRSRSSPPRTPTPSERWDAWLAGLAAVLGPLLYGDPAQGRLPAPGRPGRAGRLLRGLRGVDARTAVDLTRLFTVSIADLVEERFESDAMRGRAPRVAG